ncbi:hypothetical protein Nepgr_017884 [Nepenthes gracilis]|uniref:Uncharacterized protein n=1 Tax=Nepenthes gracilis TaxID=150966 RepID=A0AAD3SRB2_NEPGR|nr:hypothetical protein Nepgr_017884 [Nepenthes gracilis]
MICDVRTPLVWFGLQFFNWVQNKLSVSGRQGHKPDAGSANYNYYLKQQPNREEFKDWAYELLAIGTFGNNHTNNNPQMKNEQENSSSYSSPDLTEFTAEEVGKLQKELTKPLKRKPAAKKEEEEEDQVLELPFERFLSYPSSFEVSHRISGAACSDGDYREDDIERAISVIIAKCKEVRAEKKKKKKEIGTKAVSFLLKKMIVCATGFSAAHCLRDPLQESRMEKPLRTTVRKKTYPASSLPASSMKRCIESNKHIQEMMNEEESEESARASKWVKTDSEYIVLEI